MAGRTSRLEDAQLRSKLCENIGRVQLDQYFWDERLRHDTQERENIVRDAATFIHESMEYGSYSNNTILIGAQVAYLIITITQRLIVTL